MSEAILREDWLIQVERAFKKLKTANTAERNEYCEVIREDWGRDAEAELKARLTAHDQATIKPTAVVVLNHNPPNLNPLHLRSQRRRLSHE